MFKKLMSKYITVPKTSGPSTVTPYVAPNGSTSYAPGSHIPSGLTSTTNTFSMNWTEKEKKTLAKVGFKWNKKTQLWEISLTAIASFSEIKEIMGGVEANDSMLPDIAIKAMKQLKSLILIHHIILFQ